MDGSGANRGAIFKVPVVESQLEHGFRHGWLAFLAFAFRFGNKCRDISRRGEGLRWLRRRLRGRRPRQCYRSHKAESETDYHCAHETSQCPSSVTRLSNLAISV